ncbi:MAG TPA: cupin [Bacillota bacterium]
MTLGQLTQMAVRPELLAEFSAERFAAVPLAQTERYKVMVLGFEPGQFIPVHTPGIDLLALVLRGRGHAEVGGERIELQPGVLFTAPQHVSRGIFADEQTVVLAYVSPPPGPDDHRGVAEGLRAGR